MWLRHLGFTDGATSVTRRLCKGLHACCADILTLSGRGWPPRIPDIQLMSSQAFGITGTKEEFGACRRAASRASRAPTSFRVEHQSWMDWELGLSARSSRSSVMRNDRESPSSLLVQELRVFNGRSRDFWSQKRWRATWRTGAFEVPVIASG